MDRLIKVSLEDMAMRLLNFEVDDELSFAVYFDESKETYQYHEVSEWHGVKLIKLFDSLMFVFNYYGGLNPFIIDHSEGLTLGKMEEKLKQYHDNNEYIIEIAEEGGHYMINDDIKQMIEKMLNNGKKVQLEYNDKAKEMKVLEVTVKKIKI